VNRLASFTLKAPATSGVEAQVPGNHHTSGPAIALAQPAHPMTAVSFGSDDYETAKPLAREVICFPRHRRRRLLNFCIVSELPGCIAGSCTRAPSPEM